MGIWQEGQEGAGAASSGSQGPSSEHACAAGLEWR